MAGGVGGGAKEGELYADLAAAATEHAEVPPELAAVAEMGTVIDGEQLAVCVAAVMLALTLLCALACCRRVYRAVKPVGPPEPSVASREAPFHKKKAH